MNAKRLRGREGCGQVDLPTSGQSMQRTPLGCLSADERFIMIRSPYWRHVTLISTARANSKQPRKMQQRICGAVEA